jgi:transcriptional regulator with XRE-family HTH domain
MRRAREDGGISQRRLALAAGLGPSSVREVEEGRHEPTIGVLARIAAALGGELAVRYYPGSGPLIRDRFQTPMIGALTARLHSRWTATTEVWVTEPVRGVIDLVLADREGLRVVCEAHSQLRRLEQQVRWLDAKVEALVRRSGPAPSSLLLLRDSASTRAVAIRYADYLRTAFPARHRDAVDALVGDTPWPGAAILWMTTTRDVATLRDDPPRGITVGD